MASNELATVISLDNLLLDKITADSVALKKQFVTALNNAYRLPLLIPTVNLILTIAKGQRVRFVINEKRHFDTLGGLCQSSRRSIFDFLTKSKKSAYVYQIGIKIPTSDIIIHEITHALERESGVDLNQEFRTVIGLDMKDRKAESFAIQTAVTSTMRDELKSYEKEHIMSELLARYFQLLAGSRELGNFHHEPYTADEFTGFFQHTTTWLREIYNPLLDSLVDPAIRSFGSTLRDKVLMENVNKLADNKVFSFYEGKERANAHGKWSKAIGSNRDFYESFQKVGFTESNSDASK